ncbi:MAG: polysaccharide deacetylase family protein, partial [Candidatus Aenigmarchaeota archaeon]|nr:polysaccharide deacetylase family protein [Candidatus Aenigmarchaeota archaeon]
MAQDPAVERYTVSAKRFEEVIDGIPPKVCCTISEFLRKTEGQWLIFTFDDGFISDFEISFPLLRERGLTATFFITVGNVGYPGYATVGQLKEMAEAGMEIGSHGLTHRYLINVPRSEATR